MYNVTIIYNCYYIDAILSGKERDNDSSNYYLTFYYNIKVKLIFNNQSFFYLYHCSKILLRVQIGEHIDFK